MIISYIMATAKNAGRLKPEPSIDFLDLMQTFSPTDLCPDCKVIRTPRSRHCAICNVCVERFDHHCPWINNCVGINNHNSFIAFLCTTFLFILSSLAIAILELVRGFLVDEYLNNWNDNPLEAMCIFEWCHIEALWYANLTIILVTGFIFIIPVRYGTILFDHNSLLFYVHIKNYAFGKTTNERFARRAQNSFSEDTTYLDKTETESLVDEGRSSRGSFANDEEKRLRRKSQTAQRKQSICANMRQMFCNKRVATQRELYERQVNKIEALSVSYREAAGTMPSKFSQRGSIP